MEGLEIVDLAFSTVNHDNESKRLDAEFYQKRYIDDDRLLSRYNAKKLVNITSKIDVGFVGAMVSEYKDSGIKLLQTKNVDEFFINHNDIKYIDEAFNNILKKSIVKHGDILIARSGSFGKASLYLDEESVNSSDIIIVEANAEVINPFYLVSFLNSSFGVNQLIKFASGGVQGHVNLTILEQLNVPIVEDVLQINIEQKIRIAYDKVQTSKKLYSQAETILLEELGGVGSRLGLGKVVTAVKTLKDSFKDSGRLDAEYYQPKFDVIETILKKNGEYKLHDHYRVIRSKNYTYIESGDVDVIKTKQVKKGAINFDIEDCTTSQIVKDDKLPLVQDGDLVFASMGKGSMGKVSLYYSYQHERPLTIDSTLRIFRQKDTSIINPESLLVLINSDFYQEYILKYEIGSTGITSLYEGDINNLLVPKLSLELQNIISEKVQESFRLRKQSKMLLEAAKKAVEIAIEQNEEEAIKYLNAITQ